MSIPERTLGLKWNATEDNFHLTFNTNESEVVVNALVNIQPTGVGFALQSSGGGQGDKVMTFGR